MTSAGVTEFRDDDAGYVAWRDSHPHGWVVNTRRNPTPSYLVLHRATCTTITVLQSQASTWMGQYMKACSDDRAALERWAHSLGGELDPCQRCNGRASNGP